MTTPKRAAPTAAAPERKRARRSRATPPRRYLVQEVAQKLRDRVFAHAPEEQIGSLPELAKEFGVGIVTIQQAARILEHEGLLDVRRGPGGGYYGTRPDETALERSITTYMRTHGPAYVDAVDIMSLIENQIVPAAAQCTDPALMAELRALGDRLDEADSDDHRFIVEEELQNLLFRMVHRPFIELICRVTMRMYRADPLPPIFRDGDDLSGWRQARRRLVDAILDGDADLARFEARRMRRRILEGLRDQGLAPAA